MSEFFECCYCGRRSTTLDLCPCYPQIAPIDDPMAKARAEGAAAERAAVVAWLTEREDWGDPAEIIAALEAGAHREGKP